MAVACIFDGQFMQIEFFLHLGQLRRLGIFECNPDEAVRALQVIADFFNRDVG
ncbi:hypothetical protein D3C81_2022510 [compost metagenome]